MPTISGRDCSITKSPFRHVRAAARFSWKLVVARISGQFDSAIWTCTFGQLESLPRNRPADSRAGRSFGHKRDRETALKITLTGGRVWRMRAEILASMRRGNPAFAIMSEASTARAPGVVARIDEARRLAETGKILEAEQAFLEVLREAPTETDALNFVAICFYERGHYAQALALLERARGHSGGRSGDVEEHQSWRDVRRTRPARPIDRRTPHGAEARAGSVRRAAASWRSARARRSRQRCAAALFWRDFRGARCRAMARRRDHAGGPSAAGVACDAHGRGGTSSVVRESLVAAAPAITVRRRWRVEKCLAVYLTELDANYPDPKQRPKFLYFPDLPAKKYYEAELFPWYATLETNAEAIRDEMMAVLAADNGFEPFLGHFDSDKLEGHLTNAIGPPVWNAFFFFRHGTRYDDNHRRCPVTSAALGDVPLCHVRDHSPEVCYSVLTAGSHILPHHGVTNTRLVTHLALIVPEDCALVVGGEPHGWEEGRCVTFDDTFEHEAWNRSSPARAW